MGWVSVKKKEKKWVRVDKSGICFKVSERGEGVGES